jgi:urate oxidase
LALDSSLAPTEAECWLQHAVTSALRHHDHITASSTSATVPPVQAFQGQSQVQLTRLLLAYAQRTNGAAQSTVVVLLRQQFQVVQTVMDAQVLGIEVDPKCFSGRATCLLADSRVIVA